MKRKYETTQNNILDTRPLFNTKNLHEQQSNTKRLKTQIIEDKRKGFEAQTRTLT